METDSDKTKSEHLNAHDERLGKLTLDHIFSLPDDEIMSYANLMVGENYLNGFTIQAKYFPSEEDAAQVCGYLNQRIKIILEKQGHISPPRKAAYFGISGTLLDKYLQPSQCLYQFLEYVTEHYLCFWLSSHARNGDPKAIYQELRAHGVPEVTIRLLSDVWPSHWDILKTEAIDFNREFIWFEDQPTTSELKVLASHGKLDSLYQPNRAKGDSLCTWLQAQKK